MKILITGASGLLGNALLRVLPHEIVPCALQSIDGWQAFDIACPIQTMEVVTKHKPDLIIHCAAVGSVDKVQTDVTAGLMTNLFGTINIVSAATTVSAKLITISTNAVFDGTRPPYIEESHLCPINNYGIIKAASEFVVRASKLDWMIMRPILMYGNHRVNGRPNWVTIWLNKLKNNQECLVVNDTITQPLYNFDCAEVIKKAIDLNLWGNVFNVGGSDNCTLYEFALMVARVYGHDERLIKAVPSSYFPNIAPRPQDTSYSLAKVRSILHHSPIGIYDGLNMMRQELPDA